MPQIQHQKEGGPHWQETRPAPAPGHLLPSCSAVRPGRGRLPAAPDELPEGRRAHLLEAVDHEEDVGVADPGFFPFAVHGVLTGGCKHLLEGDLRMK